MFKLIALDLDGTLLHSDKGLTEYTANVLKKYIDRGCHVVVASGRAYASLPDSIKEFPGIDYYITSNGAAVYQKSRDEKIFHFTLKEASAIEVLRIAKEHCEVFECFIDGKPYASASYVRDPYAYGQTKWGYEYVRRTRQPVEDLYTFAMEHIRELDAIDLIQIDSEKKKALWDIVSKVQGIYITASVPILIEISDERAGKGAALKGLTEYLQIDTKDIAAFGNEMNDADMMIYAGTGVAVANASDEVKAIADVVVGTNDEDGVAIYLEEMM